MNKRTFRRIELLVKKKNNNSVVKEQVFIYIKMMDGKAGLAENPPEKKETKNIIK